MSERHYAIERDEDGPVAHMVLMGANNFAGESQACLRPSCERSVPPQRVRRGKPKVYCSDHCAKLHWEEKHPRLGTQRALDFVPPPEPVQPIGPTPAQIRASQKRQTVRVLRMLQEAGPAGVSTGDFLRAGIGRFGARIGELAVFWQIERRRETDHSWRYVLLTSEKGLPARG